LPSKNSTTTSHPTRGSAIDPEVWSCVVRIQQEAFSSRVGDRSQWNFTLQRPNSSVWIVSELEPAGTITVAV
jgi:hypothetical protein